LCRGGQVAVTVLGVRAAVSHRKIISKSSACGEFLAKYRLCPAMYTRTVMAGSILSFRSISHMYGRRKVEHGNEHISIAVNILMEASRGTLRRKMFHTRKI
jgi:hypothetical protein